ncbi:DUF190 domain-containing protein [Streptomyces sp. NPDC048441]|uniref:DUF190 domain-containing protein n=1 Tax=Streptomyces sp. NPDC048441 TaxID=3365552 RepID=UPI0037243D7C
MPRSTATVRLTIQLPGAALWRHRPAYAEIVHRARGQGLAGATVFHAVEGFGADRRLHRERALRVTSHGPCEVVIVENEPRLRAFLLSIADILEQTAASAILERVRVHRPGAIEGRNA